MCYSLFQLDVQFYLHVFSTIFPFFLWLLDPRSQKAFVSMEGLRSRHTFLMVISANIYEKRNFTYAYYHWSGAEIQQKGCFSGANFISLSSLLSLPHFINSFPFVNSFLIPLKSQLLLPLFNCKVFHQKSPRSSIMY